MSTETDDLIEWIRDSPRLLRSSQATSMRFLELADGVVIGMPLGPTPPSVGPSTVSSPILAKLWGG